MRTVTKGVHRAQLPLARQLGQDGVTGGIEESAHCKLQRGQGVEQPDVAGIAHEKKSEDDSHPDQVGRDENVFAVIAVGYDAGDGADEEWGEHAYDEERADRQARLRQQADQRGRGDQVEPVAQQAGDLAEPEKTKVAVLAEKLRIADGGLGGGIRTHVVGALFPHAPQRGQAALDCLNGRIGVALVFDDIPLGAADGFAGFEYGWPVGVILADDRIEGGVGIVMIGAIVQALGEWFEMDGHGAAGVAADDVDGVGAAEYGIAGIELHDDGLVGVAEEGIPRCFAVERSELVEVVVIAGAHSCGGEAGSEAVGEFGELEPVVAALAQLFGDAGDDEFVVAQGMVEGDGGVQRVVLHQVEGHMPAGAGEAKFFQFRFQFGGGMLGRACELDAVVAHLRHGGQRAGHIGGKFMAHGKEL